MEENELFTMELYKWYDSKHGTSLYASMIERKLNSASFEIRRYTYDKGTKSFSRPIQDD